MTKILIYRPEKSESDALLLLLQMQFIEHDIEYSVDELEAAINELLGRRRLGFIIMAKIGTKAVGCAVVSFAWTLEHGGKSAWLDELYVLPEYRCRGIGGLMLERVIEVVKREDCAAIDLEIEQEHQRAEHLYARKGFFKLNRSRLVQPLR